jgi:mutator protein MutT
MKQENEIKIDILRKFKNNDKLKYSQIHNQKLCSSSQFDYHLKKIISQKLIIKNKNEYYTLTHLGMQHISEIDGTEIKIKKKPFVCGFLIAINDKNEFLLKIRSKQPFLNFYNVPGGKVDLGETTKECAIREFSEETGLQCKTLKLKAICEKLSYNENNELIHHIIGYFYITKDASGTLTKNNSEGENEWINLENLKNKLKFPELEHLFPQLLENNNEIIIENYKRTQNKDNTMTFKIIK